MAASDENRDIDNELNAMTTRLEYVSQISVLNEQSAYDLRLYNDSEISKQFWLDTKHVVTARKTYNRKCLYDIFGELTDMSGDEVKQLLLEELNGNKEWYSDAGTVSLGMRGVKFGTWLKKLSKPRTIPDELCLYALCVIHRRHALVYTGLRPWCTLKKTPSMTLGIVAEICETTLLYLGNNLYGIL